MSVKIRFQEKIDSDNQVTDMPEQLDLMRSSGIIFFLEEWGGNSQFQDEIKVVTPRANPFHTPGTERLQPASLSAGYKVNSIGYFLKLQAFLLFPQDTRKPEECELKPISHTEGRPMFCVFYNEFLEAAGKCLAF